MPEPPTLGERAAMALVHLLRLLWRLVRWSAIAGAVVVGLHWGAQPPLERWVLAQLRVPHPPHQLGWLIWLCEAAIAIEVAVAIDGALERRRARRLAAPAPARVQSKVATIATLDAARARREKRAQEREDKRSADALLRAAAKLDAAAQALTSPPPAPAPVTAPKPAPVPKLEPEPPPPTPPPAPAPAPPPDPKPAKVKPAKAPKPAKEPKPPKERKPKAPKPHKDREPLRSRLHRQPKEPQPTVAWDYVKLVDGRFLAILQAGSTQRRIVAADLDALEAAAHESLLAAVRTGAWPARALVGRELSEAWEANPTLKEIVS